MASSAQSEIQRPEALQILVTASALLAASSRRAVLSGILDLAGRLLLREFRSGTRTMNHVVVARPILSSPQPAMA